MSSLSWSCDALQPHIVQTGASNCSHGNECQGDQMSPRKYCRHVFFAFSLHIVKTAACSANITLPALQREWINFYVSRFQETITMFRLEGHRLLNKKDWHVCTTLAVCQDRILRPRLICLLFMWGYEPNRGHTKCQQTLIFSHPSLLPEFVPPFKSTIFIYCSRDSATAMYTWEGNQAIVRRSVCVSKWRWIEWKHGFRIACARKSSQSPF